MRRPHGRAFIDPENPEPAALCDKCGFMWSHSMLTWQFDWMGDRLQNKRILVCPECLDEKSMFLKTIRIPADPPPVYNVRPGQPMLIDGANTLTLSPPPGIQMFPAIGGMDASLALVRPPKSISMTALGQYLSMVTGTTTPNQSTFSVSIWLKPNVVTSSPSIFRCEYDMAGPNLFRLNQDTDTDIDIADYTDGISTQRARNDGSGGSPGFISVGVWTHILYAIDTMQPVEADRIKIYKDGALVTTYFSKPCAQASIFPNFMRSNTLVTLGSNQSSNRERLAFIQVIDGTQAAPTDVGHDVAGTWSHKPYAGSFGSTGFYFAGDDGLYTRSGFGQPYEFTNGGAAMDPADVPPYVSY